MRLKTFVGAETMPLRAGDTMRYDHQEGMINFQRNVCIIIEMFKLRSGDDKDYFPGLDRDQVCDLAHLLAATHNLSARPIPSGRPNVTKIEFF